MPNDDILDEGDNKKRQRNALAVRVLASLMIKVWDWELILDHSVVDVGKERSSVKMIWVTVMDVGLAGVRAMQNVVI